MTLQSQNLKIHDPDDPVFKLRMEVQTLTGGVDELKSQLWKMQDEMAYLRRVNDIWQACVAKLIAERKENTHAPPPSPRPAES